MIKRCIQLLLLLFVVQPVMPLIAMHRSVTFRRSITSIPRIMRHPHIHLPRTRVTINSCSNQRHAPYRAFSAKQEDSKQEHSKQSAYSSKKSFLLMDYVALFLRLFVLATSSIGYKLYCMSAGAQQNEAQAQMQPASIWGLLAEGKHLNRQQTVEQFVSDCNNLKHQNAAIPNHEKNDTTVRIATYN